MANNRSVHLILFLILFYGCKNTDKTTVKDAKAQDSLSVFHKNDSTKIKTIYYPSKKKDSFNLRVRYLNDKHLDSGYITSNGFRNGKWVDFTAPTTKRIVEFININNKQYTNQFWVLVNNDTLDKKCKDCGNYYKIRYKGNKLFKDSTAVFQIILQKSYENEIKESFFIFPKGGDFGKLNSDFSNLNEIELDTIFSLNKNSSKKQFYSKYWDKRIISFNLTPESSGEHYIRGILVERVDNDKGKELFRNLYVNENVYVEDGIEE